MRKLLFFWFCLLPLIFLSALDDFDEPQDVATTEGLPSSLVNGCVCAITGEYTDFAVDLVVPGPEPLVISRTYNSFSGHRPWNFNHKDRIYTDFGGYRNKAHLACYLYQGNGGKLNYICEAKKYTKDILNEFEFVVPQGLTNGTTALSGKTNLKNQKFYRSKDEIKVITGAGNLKTFKDDSSDNTYLQTSEEKVNGSRYKYEGEAIGLVGSTKITCENKQTKTPYSSVSIKLTDIEEGHCHTFETSDKRKLVYNFTRHRYHTHDKNDPFKDNIPINRYYLKEVDHEYGPKEKYRYGKKALNRDWQITSKSRDEGKRFLNIDYYHEGINEVGGTVGSVDFEKDDFRLDRVKKLKAPVGANQTPITTHRFEYKFNRKRRKDSDYEKVLDGDTNVYDAKNHKTRYSCDEEHRLTAITRYSGNGEDDSPFIPYTKESYVWNDEGYLTAKFFRESSGMIHHARFFTYDERGNVITSTLCGNLSGNPDAPQITLNENGKPIENGYEREIKTFTYSNDGLNLLLTETDSRGKTIRYQYEEKSDRQKSKFISYDNRIQLREFYYYDKNYALKEKVTDDGINELDTDLTGVTERHYLIMTPRIVAPIGLPECIEERYFSKDKKKELSKRSTCDYSPEGRLIKQQVYDADGKLAYTLLWDYDKHGNLISETNQEGETITKEYDLATDNLIWQKQTSQTFTIENEYDFANRPITQKEIHGNEEFVTNRKYNILSQCRSITNPFGHETEQNFDDFGRIISIEYPPLPNEEGILVTPTIHKEYDCGGFPTLLTDANGNTTHIKSNIRGQATQIVYPDGSKEEMRYSSDGKLLQKTEKNGTKIEYIRDPLGRVLVETVDGGDQKKKTTHRYNALHLLETKDPEGNITSYTYDKAGRLIKTCKNNRCTENLYDSLSRLSETREYYGDKPNDYRATIKKYDKADRIIEETLQTAEGHIVHFSAYEYDNRGNRILEQVGDQKTTTLYDSHNQPIQVIDSLGHATNITYNYRFINSHQQQVLQTTMTDPLGYLTIDTYDTANRIVETVRLNPLGIKVARQTNHYDLGGNKKRVEEEVIENGKVVRTIQTKFQYNSSNEITQITEAANTPEQKITCIHYNSFGQKDSLIKPDGTILHYTYDSFGRLKTTTSSDQSISYSYQYNLLDQVLEVEDLISQKKTQRFYHQGDLIKETLSNGLSLDLTYDKTGRAKTITFPDQTGLEYTYDAVDLKEIHRTIDGKKIYTHHNVEHSLSGQLLKATLPGSNGSIDYAYDSIGHCIKIDSSTYQQHVPPDGFDAAGNLLEFEAQNNSYQFTYDDHYQINSESGHATHTYAYDSLSNRTSKDSETLQHNSLNQVIQRGKEKLVYDLNGNLIKNGSFKYAYDALDRLIKVTQNKNETHYTYDAFNRRVGKKHNDEEEFFLYQGQEEIGRWKNGQAQELRLLGKNPRSPMVALEINGVAYTPLHDMSGNVVCLLNHQGEVVERYRYTAFGESEIFTPSGKKLQQSALNNPWQYASKRLDNETGLIAFGIRYYDPSLGRWITPDPAGFTDGPNLYAYVCNSPLLHFDQFGLFTYNPMTQNIMSSFFSFSDHQETQVHYVPYEKYFVSNLTQDEHLNSLSAADDILPASYYPESVGVYDYSKTRTFNSGGGSSFTLKESPNMLFAATNGIMNNYRDFESSLGHLSQLADHNQIGVHSPSFGLATDLMRYFTGRMGIATESAKATADLWKDYLGNNPQGYICWTTHSRGCVDTRNALIMSSQEVRERMIIVAVAPGCFIDQHLCREITHLVSLGDVIPFLDVPGMIRCMDTIEFLSGSALLSHSLNDNVYKTKLKTIYNDVNDRYAK